MGDPAVKSFFSIHEAVVLTGFSKHMLDYLRREDIFAPTDAAGGRGVARRYAYADVVLLRALKGICAGKGKVRHLKRALTSFRREFGPLRPGQQVDKHLFVEGDELCVRSGDEGARLLRNGQLTLGFVVDLASVSGQVAASVLVADGGQLFSLVPEVAAQAEAVRQQIWAAARARRAMNLAA